MRRYESVNGLGRSRARPGPPATILVILGAILLSRRTVSPTTGAGRLWATMRPVMRSPSRTALNPGKGRLTHEF
ncbi:hypothetical protein GCM10009682_36130 [Luedemannella flava]|uniref:Uncharacterized protein n=1 Tax=Luedemannella flava TaxID=349316 RepID=A0ABP4YD18_9ACTN